MANIRKKITSIYHTKEKYTPKNNRESLLMKALIGLKNEGDVAALLRDMLTESEIAEFANRLTIVRLLDDGLPYLQIAEKVGTSTTTVTRVAHWLYNGCGGYQAVLNKLKK